MLDENTKLTPELGLNAVNCSVIANDDPECFLELDAFADAQWGDGYVMEDPNRDYFDRPKWIVAAKMGNEVVGVIYLFPRTVTYEGVEINLVGIGEVVVHQDHRGKGIAKKMLTQAMSFLNSTGNDVAILATEIDKLGGLYGKFGFEEMNNSYFFTDRDGVQREEDEGMIAALSSPDKVDLIQKSDEHLHIGISNI